LQVVTAGKLLLQLGAVAAALGLVIIQVAEVLVVVPRLAGEVAEQVIY
jgi:hypothetical protein